MAAITRHPAAAPALPAPHGRPQLRLLPGGLDRPKRRRLPQAVYVRRRVVALAVVVVVVAALSGAVTWAAGALASPRAPGPAAAAPAPGTVEVDGPADTYVVQHGDTLWAIARRLQPTGDVRPLVHQLVQANGGATVRPGQVLVVG